MTTARVVLAFEVSTDHVQELVAGVEHAVEEMRDRWSCPAVSAEDMRCELPRGHGDRHAHGTLSWQETGTVSEVATRHYPCPPLCHNSGPHHHWHGPLGMSWTILGNEADCPGDEQERLEAGTL